MLLHLQIIMLNYILILATFLKHFVSSLIRIKFERMQIHFFVKFLLLLLSLYAFKKLPIDLTGWLIC